MILVVFRFELTGKKLVRSYRRKTIQQPFSFALKPLNELLICYEILKKVSLMCVVSVKFTIFAKKRGSVLRPLGVNVTFYL